MDTNQLATITKLTIQGKSTREIGDVIGVAHNTVAFHQKKPDIKAKVEAGINQLINRGLKPAISTLCRAAAYGNQKDIAKPENRDLLKISVDASNRILSHVSGSGPQTVINQLIYSQGTHAELSTDALSMVDRALGLQDNQDVIDLSPVDKPVDK